MITSGSSDPYPSHCPQCNSLLRGARIPPERQEQFGGASHFWRWSHVYPEPFADKWTHIRCPDCGFVLVDRNTYFQKSQ